MTKPIKFHTLKGNRVFRLAYSHGEMRKFSDNYTYRIKRHGKQYDFNVGGAKKAAGKRADEIAAFLAVRSNSIEAAISRFLPGKTERPGESEHRSPTIGEIIQRYEAKADRLRPATVRDNAGALRRIAAFVLNLPPNQKKMAAAKMTQWREKVEQSKLNGITVEQLESFRSSMIASATGNNAKARATTTSNFYIRAARSIFSQKMLKHYADFILPEPNPFQETGQLEESPHRYVSTIEAGALVIAAEKELRKQHPASYVAFVLSLYCGLRRNEIDRLTWEQIDSKNGHIWIRTTDYFVPKARNSESRIDAPGFVFAALEEFRPLSLTPPYVLPGTNPKYPPRCKQVFRVLLSWLRQNGVSYVQALHALRKEAGSLMYAQTGSIDQAAEFLRNDPRVAREHYIGRKGRLELNLPPPMDQESRVGGT